MFIRSKVLFYILFIAFIPVLISAQDFKTVSDGIEYAEVIRGTEKEPIHINLLRLDLKKVRLDVVHALDAAIGLEKTSSIAMRHGAFAAINAGFFKMDGLYKGDPAGVLQIDGKLWSESYADRTALQILSEKKKTLVDFLHLNAVATLDIKGKYYPLALNRAPKANEIALFTSEFRQTVDGDPAFTDFIFSQCSKGCKSVSISESKPGLLLPSDGYILRFNEKQFEKVAEFLRGQAATASAKPYLIGKTITSQDKLPDVNFVLRADIVAGVPQLIKNGKIDITWEQEKTTKEFVETHHPRTAVAKLKDGKFLMVTVDGRQPAYSNGMSLQMLAEFLLQLGATDAMNLDGGGSTTMYLDGKVMNKPSDKEGERPVSDAILVFPRKK